MSADAREGSDCPARDEHPSGKLVAALNPRCIVCGTANPRGLQLEFRLDEQCVQASWQPTEEWASFRGTIHGGIITAVLDEAMSKTVIAMGKQAYTVDLRVRFHRVVRPGESYGISAWIVDRRKRRIRTEARVVSKDGIQHAHAWASFLLL